MDWNNIHCIRNFFILLLCVAVMLMVLTKSFEDQEYSRIPAVIPSQNASSFQIGLRQVNFKSMAPTSLDEDIKNALTRAILEAQKEKKIILEWYGDNTKAVSMTGVCGFCEVTSNKSMITNNATKAVIFNYKHIFADTMPDLQKRRKDQFYVWQTGEAPPALLFLHRRYFQYEEKVGFNLTQSFRRDADIYHPYGSSYITLYKKKKTKYARNLTSLLDNKRKVAISVISNCHSMPGSNIRLQFVRDLKAGGLNLHTLGRCFKYKTFPKIERNKFVDLLKTYKFYLAFENSYHCRDYITEKFFVNALDVGSVPVVWGATKEDYDAIAPPGSYIYADGFSTIKELINYLHYLDKNDTAYLEYFKWYQMPLNEFPEFGRQIRYCQLCRILHGINVDDIFHPSYNKSTHKRPLISDKIYPRTAKSLYNWYYKTDYKDCMKSSSRFYRDNVSLAARTLAQRT